MIDMIQVGDMIRITDYGNPDDIDLIDWAYEQDQDSFKICEIDTENRRFYIEGCEYGISFDSVDYVLEKERGGKHE